MSQYAQSNGARAPERSGEPSGAPDSQAAVNTRIWGAGGLVFWYARRRLLGAEVALFERYRRELSGRVLELGCGAGRLTGHLSGIASDLHAIDIAADMVAYCQQHYPSATVTQQDMSDLSSFATGSFDAIVAGANVIDVVGDDGRAKLLDELHRLLRPNGLLIFSSHNLASAPHLNGPTRNLTRNPVRFAYRVLRLRRSVANHRRLVVLEQRGGDYAILNDEAHDYGLLHYYIGRDDQERQLGKHHFELLACLEPDGGAIAPGESAADSHELHYAAKRSDRAES